MKLQDHEFDPVTPEEEAQREQEAELARRIRREVLRVRSGEADDDIRADEEQQAEERAEEEQRAEKERRRESNTMWKWLSGTILSDEGTSKFYPYMLSIAGVFFLSISVMFMSLHLDMKYTRLDSEVRKLRERSIRLQEVRFRQTSYSAIEGRLRARGLDLTDPASPDTIIEN